MLSLYFEGALLGLLVAISLGPAFFAIIQTSINKGFKYGVFMAMGISLSDIMLVTISYLIGATLFDDPQNKVYIGLIGGIILIIFGSVSWAKKPEILKRRNINYVAPTNKPPFLYIIRGFFLNIANPFLFFFWFGALGFVGKNAIEGEMLESTIMFFAGTFSVVFATDILKSYIGNKIKGFLRPRKELILNKIVGIALVIFGIILMYRTLDDIGFFKQVEDKLGAQVEAQYDIKHQKDKLVLTLYKDSSFVSTASIYDTIHLISGTWKYIDTTQDIFEITILKSSFDSIVIPSKRMYKHSIIGIIPYVDSSSTHYSPNIFDPTKSFDIQNIRRTKIIVPNKNETNINCKDWNLNQAQIIEIIHTSKKIELEEFNLNFNTTDAFIKAHLVQEGKTFRLLLNAGSWFSISSSDSSIFYGNYNEATKELFCLPPKN
jgi:threonine/homoserine/homoserine lactone efflux protein